MNETIITIGTETFKLKFGLKVFRILGKLWNCPGIDEVMARFVSFESIEGNLTFDQIDTVVDLVRASIMANPENVQNLSTDEIADWLFQNTSELEKIMGGFAASLQTKDQGKLMAPKKNGAKK